MAERIADLGDVKIATGSSDGMMSIHEMQRACMPSDTIRQSAYNAALVTYAQHPELGVLPSLDEYEQIPWSYEDSAAYWLVSLSELPDQRRLRSEQERRDQHCMQGYDWMG